METIVQPALGSVVLPDGISRPIDGTFVLGRQPSAAAARVDEPAELCPITASADVSRTHLVVRAAGWPMEAIDCGSTGRSVLVPGNGSDPAELEPWVPHEIVAGDVIHLGGPTAIRIVP